jgi:threonine synthase
MDETGAITRQADLELMRKEIFAISISDKLTRQTIRKAYDKHNVLLEPHGAVGWAGLWKFLDAEGDKYPQDQLYVSLETAHPAKFPEEINKILGFDPELPPSLEGLEEKEEQFDHIEHSYEAFKKYLLDKY